MKHFLYILMCIPLLCWTVACTNSQDLDELLTADEKQSTGVLSRTVEWTEVDTIHLDSVGTLRSKLGDRINTVQKLILSGQFDAVDLMTLKSMTNLVSLDMKNVTIIGGDSLYYGKLHMYVAEWHTLSDNEIGFAMFASMELAEIILPSNITYIDQGAFYHVVGRTIDGTMYGFTEIEIPEGVTSIHAYTFMGCTNLNSIVIPNGVTEIGYGAFHECSSLSSITLPSELEAIGARAFSFLGLTSIDIPANIDSIGYHSFYSCTDLSTVTLSDSGNLKKIESYAFYGCSSLSSITLPSGLETLEEYAFGDTGLVEMVIPETVTTIGSRLFSGCTSLQSVVFNNSMTSIGGYTFLDCTSLTSVKLPDDLLYIGNYEFSGCSSLKNIDIPETVFQLSVGAFWGSGLTHLILPEGLQVIGQYAFVYCDSLAQISLPSTLVTINDEAFYGCSALAEITIPVSVTFIGSSAFEDCTNLVKATVNCSVMGESMFAFCNKLSSVTLNEGITTLPSGVFKNSYDLTTINIPTNVTTIENAAFSYSGLTEITIPASVETIAENAFRRCESLTTVTFAESGNLTTIGDYAFESTLLAELTLPEGLQAIGGYAFSDCSNLKSVSIPSTVTTFGNNLFYGDQSLSYILYNASVDVPNNMVSGRSGAEYLNPNLLFYVPQGVAMNDGKINNVIVDGTAESIVLTSSSYAEFYVPQAFTANSISYTQEYTFPTYPGVSAGWRSISLPFTPTTITHFDGRILAPFNSGVADSKPFWLRRLTSTGFTASTSIEAGVPYIIAMPNNEVYDEEYRISGDVTFAATNVAMPVTSTADQTQDRGSAYLFSCNYGWHSSNEENIYVLNEDVTTYYAGSRFVRNNRSAHPFEGIVSIDSSASAPAYFLVGGGAANTRATRTPDGKPHIDDL